MAEYLASGRPVLVHAPRDSFVSWYFNRYECGLVVDRKDPAALSQAIWRLPDDADLRRVGANAHTCAERDFSLEVTRSAFLRLLLSKGRVKRAYLVCGHGL